MQVSSSAKASLADILEAALDVAERDCAVVKRTGAASAELARVQRFRQSCLPSSARDGDEPRRARCRAPAEMLG
jgi:ribosomal protein L36